MKMLIGAVIAFKMTLSTFAQAADFTDADNMFDERHLGAEHYKATVKAYSDIIASGNLATDELFYAVGQINRMHILYGDYVLRSFVKDEYKSSLDLTADWKPSNVDKARKDTFDACLANAELISVNNPSLQSVYANDTGIYLAQYYYWRLACLALRIEASGVLERPGFVIQLIPAMNPALGLTNKTFEGGGVLRSISGVKANPLAVIFGLADKQGSLDILITTNKILELPAHPQDNYSRTGRFFYNNYRYIARAWVANNNVAEAKKAFSTGISNIEETLEILADGDEDSYTPTEGNIFELSLEKDRLEFESSEL